MEVLEIPDAGQPFAHLRKAEDQPTTNVELTRRPSSMNEDEDQIPPATRPGTAGSTPSHVVTRDAGGDRSPPDEDAPHHDRDLIRHIVDETATQYVKRGLYDILTRLRNVEKPSNWTPQHEEFSTLVNRLAALESSTNRSLP